MAKKQPGNTENLSYNKVDIAETAISKLAAAIDQDLEPIGRDEIEIAIPDVVLDPEYRQPWDWNGKESAYQYKMFLNYRDQGLGRTVSAVQTYYQEHQDELPPARRGKKLNLNHLHTMSTKHEWKARALSWDNDQEEQYQLARSEAIREMVVRHEDTVVEALDSLTVPIKALSMAMEDEDFVKNLSKTDAKKLISMSNQAARTMPALMSAERLARDMPTEIVGGAVNHEHVVAVERDQIGEILEVLGRAGVLDVGGGNLGTGEIVDAEVVDVHPISAEDND